MKTITLSFLLLLSTQLFAQTCTDRYIVVNAEVYEWRGPELTYIEYPKNDTLIDNKVFNGLYGKKPSDALNVLAKDGWVLANTVFFPFKSQYNVIGIMQFYMRKTFITKDTLLKQ